MGTGGDSVGIVKVTLVEAVALLVSWLISRYGGDMTSTLFMIAASAAGVLITFLWIQLRAGERQSSEDWMFLRTFWPSTDMQGHVDTILEKLAVEVFVATEENSKFLKGGLDSMGISVEGLEDEKKQLCYEHYRNRFGKKVAEAKEDFWKAYDLVEKSGLRFSVVARTPRSWKPYVPNKSA